jgi:hypothetical protein
LKKKVTKYQDRRREEMKHSLAEVFHGENLDEVVDRAISKCPAGYYVKDLKVEYLNSRWVVVAKIQKYDEIIERGRQDD